MSQTTALSVGFRSEGERRATLDAIYSKIAWRLLPLLFILWMLAWIDRTNIGFAKLQMLQDLGFSETIYGLGAGIFFIGYFLFEVPSNMLLLRIGTRKTLARITIGWGAACILMLFTQSTWYFYIVRFLLGAFEAGFQPGVILYLTFWFPAHRRAKAFAIFMSAAAVSSIVGGPIAGLIINNLSGVGGLAGWQWLFLIEGIPSILGGLVVLRFLSDMPAQASWLSSEEKELLRTDLAAESAASGHREHAFGAALRDRKLWLLTLTYFCIVAANATLAFFAPSLVRELGITDPLNIGLLIGLLYMFGAGFQVLNGHLADNIKNSRLLCIVAVLVGAAGLAGVGILAGSNPILAFICLVIAVSGTMSAFPVYWQMPNFFLVGAAAAMGIAFINSIANLAGFGAPFMMGAIKDATGSFSTGLLIVAAIEACAALLIIAFIRRPSA
ncbi:MFS transporter [Microvirga sp. BT689]|uniref:MFS transporter n=1 Tax=Microvirga arvi TaxID=2778731 RepID=UPI0019528E29|nr:MFS transporter [Microvirga arvi]MBM6583492.1 MFS transporter [Microvirga arvi]